MKGYIRKRSPNSWSLCIEAGNDPETGKRKQHYRTVKGTKKDAERALRELILDTERGTYIKPSKLTLGTYLEEWLHGYVAANT